VRRTGRILGIVLAVAGGVLALALAIAAWVLFTEAGARLALSVANGRDLPVRAQSVHGTLARRFTLVGVELKTGAITATADTVRVSWRLAALRAHHIDMTDILVTGAHVTIAPAAAPPNKPRADAAAHPGRPWTVHADRLRIRSGSLDAPGNVRVRDVDITASGSPDGYLAVVRAAGSAWRLDDARAFVRVAGTTRAATADSLEVTTPDGVVHGSGFVRWTPGLAWSARLAGDDVRPGAFTKMPEDWPGVLSFRARATGVMHDDTTRVGVNLASLAGTLRGRPAFARGRVDIDGRRIAASDLVVRWGHASASLSGSMADTANVRFRANIPSLAEILPRSHGAVTANGTLVGTPTRIDVRVDARGANTRTGRWDLPNATATVDATVTAQDYRPYAADIRRVDARLAGGHATVRGRVSWRDAVEWNVRVDARNFETSVVAPKKWNLHGPLSVNASTSGRKQGKSLHAELALESLSGTLRDRPVRGAGRVTIRDREADVSNLELAWGRTYLRADGHAGKALDITVDAFAPDLAALVPSWHGALTVSGGAHGPLHRPALNATITGDSLRVNGFGANHVGGHVNVDPAFASPMDVEVTALGVSRGETAVDSVRVVASGPRDGHHVSIAVVRGALGVAVSLRGAYADTSWSGWIDDARVREPMTGSWHAVGRAPVRVSSTSVAVDSLVLASGSARLSTHASWRKRGPARGELSLSEFPLALLQRFLPGASINGVVGGAAQFEMEPDRSLNANATFTAGPGEIALGTHRLEYRANVNARAGTDGVFAEVQADLASAAIKVATLDGSISIPGFVAGVDSLAGHALAGKIDLQCRDIGPVMAVFMPELQNVSGALTADIAPVGTTDRFKIVGHTTLENARFDTRDGLRLRDVDLALVSDGAGMVTLDGGATSGGGRVMITAKSARSEQGRVSGTFSARGERFQVVNRPDARVFASPDVVLDIHGRNAQITGTVRIPYARIETTQVPASAVSSSPDVVMVEDSLSAQPKLQVHTRVRVALGDSVTFSGFGLRARLAGNLAVDDERGRPTQGTGEIQLIDGKYRAFGNELTIDPGRLVFGGPIDNPGIDVRAYRGLTTQNVMASTGEMVGVNLRGTLRKPELSVFSNPPMSQNEIMSYLLSGHAPTSGDQSALAGAAMLLAMQQGQQLAGDIGKKLSLDTYLETGTDAGETSFVAGKYLSPKLYVSYAAGLFEHTNTFRARYSLTGHWTLQGESGKYDSTDLLYWFERGK